MSPPCQCRSKCTDKITNAERLEIFTNFLNLQDRTRQWDYLARMIRSHDPKERKVLLNDFDELRKKHSYTYFLSTPNGDVKVCRLMFLNTFGKLI